MTMWDQNIRRHRLKRSVGSDPIKHTWYIEPFTFKEPADTFNLKIVDLIIASQ